MIVVLAAVQLATRLSMTYKYSFRDAFQCIAQSNTTLLDCILYLMQYLYDPGMLNPKAQYFNMGLDLELPSTANECIFGKVC